MRLTVIGSSPAWPNPGSAHSGYMLEANGHRLLLDCGPGVLGRLRESELWPQIDGIEATEEAIINALVAAETVTGRDGITAHALPHDRLREVMAATGR